MNTQSLAQAYIQLITAARLVEREHCLGVSDREAIDWRLCHIALSDEILATAVQATLDGKEVIVDNGRAMDAEVIASLVERTTLGDRIEMVHRNGDAFMECVARLVEGLGTTEVHLVIRDKCGVVVSNAVMSWCELIELRAKRHIPAHTKQLTSYIKEGG